MPRSDQETPLLEERARAAALGAPGELSTVDEDLVAVRAREARGRADDVSRFAGRILVPRDASRQAVGVLERAGDDRGQRGRVRRDFSSTPARGGLVLRRTRSRNSSVRRATQVGLLRTGAPLPSGQVSEN